ncbi:cytochrome P450 (plasmid) [Stanieria sp. NIES-3757]|nr:cytochrome P450 [Stanieria sp. NIES-3757]
MTSIEFITKNVSNKSTNGFTLHRLNMLRWVLSPLEYMEEYAAKYGDTFMLRLPYDGSKLAIFSHPQAIQEIFTATSDFVESGPANRTIEPILGSNSVLMLDGKPLAKRRKLLLPPFHGERMQAYGDIIKTTSIEVSDRWKVNRTFRLHSFMKETTLQVIFQALFGLKSESHHQQLKQALEKMLWLFNSPINNLLIFLPALRQDWGKFSPWGRFLRQRKQLENLLVAEIERCREQANPERTDVLSLLVSARDETGEALTNQEICDELITMMIAGYDTTAKALAWAFYWIHHVRGVREKLLAELATLGENADSMAIFRLPYLSAVCSETLRISPIAIIPFRRIVKSPIEIMGNLFEPGTQLVPCIYLTHQRCDLYPEPKQFKPERFLERQFSPYEYFPFGGGSRRCIGQTFALFEMKLVLATILSRCELQLTDRRPIRAVRHGFTVSPSGGVKMIMTGRKERN